MNISRSLEYLFSAEDIVDEVLLLGVDVVGRYDGFPPGIYDAKDAFLGLARNYVLAELTKTLSKVVVIAHLDHQLVLSSATLLHSLQHDRQLWLILSHPTLQHLQHVSASRRQFEPFGRAAHLQGETPAVFIVVFLVVGLRGERYSIDHCDQLAAYSNFGDFDELGIEGVAVEVFDVGVVGGRKGLLVGCLGDVCFRLEADSVLVYSHKVVFPGGRANLVDLRLGSPIHPPEIIKYLCIFSPSSQNKASRIYGVYLSITTQIYSKNDKLLNPSYIFPSHCPFIQLSSAEVLLISFYPRLRQDRNRAFPSLTEKTAPKGVLYQGFEYTLESSRFLTKLIRLLR